MKRNGFTLIELLGVILLVGIIAAIVTPSILGVMEAQKQGTTTASLYAYKDAIEDSSVYSRVSSNYQKLSPGIYDVNDPLISGIEFKGDVPSEGWIAIDDDRKVVAAKLYFSEIYEEKYAVYYDNEVAFEDYLVASSEDAPTELIYAAPIARDTIVDVLGYDPTDTKYRVYANGEAVYFNPETRLTCTAAEAVSTPGVKSGCMKWYAFNDDGEDSSQINLILDHNTTTDGVPFNSTGDATLGPDTMLSVLESDTNSWTGVLKRKDKYTVDSGVANYTLDYTGLRARIIEANEIARITGNTSFDESSNSSIFFLDSNTNTKTATTPGASSYAWLFDYTQNCTSSGCNINYTYSYGYWTSTSVTANTNIAWFVHDLGKLLSNIAVNTHYNGIRPVITLYKDILE